MWSENTSNFLKSSFIASLSVINFSEILSQNHSRHFSLESTIPFPQRRSLCHHPSIDKIVTGVSAIIHEHTQIAFCESHSW